jgi:thiamine biosynthesis protein ThiI
MINSIICRYHEIAIKGGNRMMFENTMIENLYFLLEKIKDIKIRRSRGRIWIKHNDGEDFSREELEIIKVQLSGKAFGLESFSPAAMTEPDMESLRLALRQTAADIFNGAFRKKNIVSFKIRARRSDKKFKLTSKEIEIKLATEVAEMFNENRLEVDLTEADVTVGCEMREEFSVVFYETIRAPGGLPAGSNSPLLALLSGGIDSPAACYMAMKRGCRVNFITFHSAPYTPPETVDKVKKIVEVINRCQKPGKLYICNLAPIQKMIRDKCSERFRTVLYRRMMLRIAAAIAEKNRIPALLTGDSIGQVASQTVINMNTINEASPMLVIRPLAGMDKNEAIRIAEKLGTFEISKGQVPDSCTVFAPREPATSAPVAKAGAEEENLGDYQELLTRIANEAEVFFGRPPEKP